MGMQGVSQNFVMVGGEISPRTKAARHWLQYPVPGEMNRIVDKGPLSPLGQEYRALLDRREGKVPALR